jgi:flagellar assembly protein FliH
VAVIRQASGNRIARDAIVLDLGDLARQGELLRSHARGQASDIIKEAHRERARLIEGADRQGFEAGLTRGLEEGLKQGMEEGREKAQAEHSARLAELEAAWTAALEEFSRERGAILTEAKQDILKLAAMLGEQVVKRTISIDPNVVVDQLSSLLALVGAGHRLRLRVSPADVETARHALPGLLARFAPGTHAEIEEDTSLLPGSCISMSERGGVVDASIHTQVQRLIEALIPGGDTRTPDVSPTTPGGAGGA